MVILVSCPTPLLEEETSGDTWAISVADWNAISADMGWVFTCDRKIDVVQLLLQQSSDNPYFLFAYSLVVIATECLLKTWSKLR